MKVVRSGNIFVIVDGQDRFVGVGTCIVVERRRGAVSGGASVSILYAGTTGPVQSLAG